MKTAISSQSLSPVLSSDKNNSGAEFTVKSKNTGKEYTFKISKSEFNGKMYTHVKVETGYLNFTRLGHYQSGALLSKGHVVTTPAAQAISWILNKVEKGEFNLLDEKVEIMHLGNCLCCGRTLTDADSISIGLGPVCRNH